MIHKMMGCSRDHAVELDIYNRPFKEKMERIRLMKEQGNKAYQAFAQAPEKTLAAYRTALEKRQAQKDEKSADDELEEENFLEKASYYYAQALLIFYYLIPETDEEEKDSNELKLSCHLNQSLVFMKLERYDDCLSELDQILSGSKGLDPGNVKALYRKACVLELKLKYDEALEVVESYYERVPNKVEKDIKLF